MRKEIERFVGTDWDGTLFDSLPLYYEVLKSTFEHFGKTPPSFRKYKNCVGAGTVDFYRKNGLKDIPEKQLRKIGAAAEKKSWKEGRPFYYSGIFLSLCFSLNIKVVVVSGNREKVIRKRIREQGWEEFISDVICAERKEEVLLQLKKEHKDHEVFFIDDIAQGVRAGKAAGYKTIGITTGFHSERVLKKEKPHYLAKSLQDALVFILRN